MSGNGASEGARPGRRVRYDRSQGVAAMPAPSSRYAGGGQGGSSGRRFVTALVLGVLVTWGSLYLAFRHWRAGYRERAAFGARAVASAVDPLAEVVPDDGADPVAWRRAVSETHAALVTLTASNVLDLTGMVALRDRVAALVARARPATARADLASLWDDLQSQAGPVVLSRHRRPSLLPPYHPRPQQARPAGRAQ